MRTPSEICKCEEVESGLGQTKPLKLQRPFGRRITESGDADAARRTGFVARLAQRRRDGRMRTASEICKCEEVESGQGETEPLKLQRPFGRRITQGGDADAARKPPFDGGLDQSRRD